MTIGHPSYPQLLLFEFQFSIVYNDVEVLEAIIFVLG